MGRAKIKMKKIEEASARQVTFSKRRQGLMKKAQELSILCDAQVAVMVFSTSGRLFNYSSTPNIKETLNKVTMHLESLQQKEEAVVVASHEGNRDHAHLSKGVLDKINLLKGLQTEYLQHCTVEEVDQLGAKLDAIVEMVSAKKARLYSSVACASGESSSSEHAAALGTGDHVIPCSGETRWAPPPTDVYKVNFAGACFQDANVFGVGIGVVVRNWRGEFMAAHAKYFPQLVDENTAAWMAVKCAVEFAVDYCFTHVMLEGDNADTLRGLQITYEDTSTSPSPPPPHEEVNGYIRQLGGACMFSLVQASCNVAAHSIAEYAATVVKDEAVWLIEEPDFLVATLLDDILHHNY